MNPDNLPFTCGQWPVHFKDAPSSTDQHERIAKYLADLGRDDDTTIAQFCGAGYVDVPSLSYSAAEHVIGFLSAQRRLWASIMRKAVLEQSDRIDLWDRT